MHQWLELEDVSYGKRLFNASHIVDVRLADPRDVKKGCVLSTVTGAYISVKENYDYIEHALVKFNPSVKIFDQTPRD